MTNDRVKVKDTIYFGKELAQFKNYCEMTGRKLSPTVRIAMKQYIQSRSQGHVRGQKHQRESRVAL